MEVIAFGKRVPRMKPAMPVGLATWMLEHLTFGRDNESLSGDLLEELEEDAPPVGTFVKYRWPWELESVK